VHKAVANLATLALPIMCQRQARLSANKRGRKSHAKKSHAKALSRVLRRGGSWPRHDQSQVRNLVLGLGYDLPFMGKRAAMPLAARPLLARLTPDERRVMLIVENVEAIDFERCATADIEQRRRMREIRIFVAAANGSRRCIASRMHESAGWDDPRLRQRQRQYVRCASAVSRCCQPTGRDGRAASRHERDGAADEPRQAGFGDACA
jgi:hypothetical protein